jgi:flagellar hook protein FlgE
MSLIGTLATGVSGVISNASALNIIGDNIANVNTTGFKSSRAVFGDLFSTSLQGGTLTSQVGQGTQLLGSLQSFEQGAFEPGSNALDLAVDGQGFFIVNDGTGNFYSRAGQFRVNENGVVQNITGELLQGFQITNNAVGTSLSDIRLTGFQSQPQATTEFTLNAQLDGSEDAGFTFNSPIQIYNSVGSQDIVNVQFTKLGTLLVPTNDWGVAFNSSIGTVTSPAITVPGPPAIPALTLEFGTSGQLTDIIDSDGITSLGVLDVPIVLDYATSSPPALGQTINWNLSVGGTTPASTTNGSMTAFAASSSNSSVIQDGFGSGILTGVAVEFDGTVAGLFDNGQSQALYQLGLANFLAPTGLARLGDNLFAETSLSGQANISLPQTGAFGSVLGNTLELSNVDLAEEFVQLIKTQQAYQASARVISTTDELLTETVNLTR